MTETDPNYTPTYCAYHPKREATLRCNRCDKPICTECAVLTPTGYRCKECVRSQQKIFDTAKTIDYPLAIVVTLVLSYLGSYSTIVGFFVIFLAPVVGVIISEAVRFVISRRRSRLLFQLVAAAAALGALPPLFSLLLRMLAFGGTLAGGLGGLLGLIWPVVYAFLVTSTVYYRLSGIRIQ